MESEKRQIQAFSWRPSSPPSLGPAGELGGQENKLRAVFCRASEPSPRPSTGLGPGLETVVNLSSILISPILPNSNGSVAGSQSVGPGPHYTGGLRSLGPVVLGTWLPQR